MYSPKLFSHLAIISANVILGINVPFTKALLESWLSPFGYILSRSVSAAVIFGIIGIVFVHEKIKPKDLAIIALGGLMGFIISQYMPGYAPSISNNLFPFFRFFLQPFSP